MSRFPDPTFPAVFTQNQAGMRDFDKVLVGALVKWAKDLKGLLDRGLNIADNFDAAVVSFTSNAAPNTEDAIAHTLGRVPDYFIQGSIDKAGVVYASGTAFTKTHIYVKTSVASAAVKLILM
jgi:hypothetical protein